MRPLIIISTFLLVSGLVFGITLKEEDPNKDKLLIEIISYVLERGHYDPKEINDAFSENVYMNYLDNLDGQHRFFLQSDINSFEDYKYQVDEQLKTAQLDFFQLTYTQLMQRMEQVEDFYKDLLSTPFDFTKKDE
ncbi:MAG: tail-specific protease, partial [Flavobacteriaceae bacterium]